ncbi:MAG: hypothetical protein RR540_07080 [Oscillospiraceae bacterium]
MDAERFDQAIFSVMENVRERASIGTFSEKTVHAVLKKYFEPFSDRHETAVGAFVADIVGENGIIEIQTKAFQNLQKKLSYFLKEVPVTVVFPVYATKWLTTISENGIALPRRKSPLKGNIYDVFKELYKISEAINSPNFRLCIVVLEVEEFRYEAKKGKRAAFSKGDRVPLKILDEIYFENISDYGRFFSKSLGEVFTAKDFAKAAKIPLKSAQFALYSMNKLEFIVKSGKIGNAILYKKAEIF